eukprot:gb/GECG01011050.1/.p1 GENE.gb/GECG01011050.1/~~gb/GECG01011050.1/.p1  ORF type:complete len:3225 (+),score=359.93 gb/GECG01011050.1/:1-9675(+)
MEDSQQQKTSSNAAGISELVRKLTEVRHRVERMRFPAFEKQSKTEDAPSNLLSHEQVEQFWKRFMKPITLRFRETEAEDVFISIAQTVAPVPGRHRHEYTSWKTAALLAALRAFLFAVAFVIVHWVLNPYILRWTTLEDQTLVPAWMAVTVYAICLGIIGIYAALVYQQHRVLEYGGRESGQQVSANYSPLSKVIHDMFSKFPGKVSPVLSALCGATFFIVPFILEIATDRRGSLIIHVVLLSVWSAFYFFPTRFIDSVLGAFVGWVIYFASLISQWDNGYFSVELFVHYTLLSALLFLGFATQKYYREKAQRIQFFSNIQQRALERDTRAIRNMKAHLITMQYPDFILRQQQRGEIARQAISTIIFAQVRIFKRTSVVNHLDVGDHDEIPTTLGVSSAGGIQRSAAAGVVSSPFTPFSRLHSTVSPIAHPEVHATDDTNEELEMLNSIFVAFDKLSKSYGVDKIKNVGQSWVGACGLDDDRPESFDETGSPSIGAQNILKFAVACMERISTMPTGKLDVRLSIGVGTETTVAGVFGSGIHQYEAVGDAVTEAHLLSTLSQNSIAVAQSTLRFVGQHFFVSRFAFQECYPMPRINNHHGYTSQYYRCFSPERTQGVPAHDAASMVPNPSTALHLPTASAAMLNRGMPANAEDSGTESYAGWSKFSYDFDFGSAFGKGMPQEGHLAATSLGPAYAGMTLPMTSGLTLPMTTNQSLLPSTTAPVPVTMGHGIISSSGLGTGALGSMPLGIQMSTAYPIGSGISPQVTSAAAARGTAGMVSSDMMAAAARGERQGNEMDDALQKKLKSLIQLGREIKRKHAEALQSGEDNFVAAAESYSNTDTGSSSISQHDSVGERDNEKGSCMLKVLQYILSAPWFRKTPFYDNVVWFANARQVHPGVAAAITRAHATSHVTLAVFVALSIVMHISVQGLTSDRYFELAHQWVVFAGMVCVLALASFRALLHMRYMDIDRDGSGTELTEQYSREQAGSNKTKSTTRVLKDAKSDFTEKGSSQIANGETHYPHRAGEAPVSQQTSMGRMEHMNRWLLTRDHGFQLVILTGLVLVLCAEQVFLDIATVVTVPGYDHFCIENQRAAHWIVTGVGLYILTLSDLSFGPAVKSSILLVSFWLMVVSVSWGVTRGINEDYTVSVDGDTIDCEDIVSPLKIWIVDTFLLFFNILTRYRQELAMMRMALSQWGMQTSHEKTHAQSETLTKAFRVLFPSHVFRLCVEDGNEGDEDEAGASPIITPRPRDLGARSGGEIKSSLFTRRVRGLLVESVHGATVLVVNMIPLQSLVGLLQPTDLFAVFATLASVCDQAVEMYGGKRARIVGSLFIAVFGLPEADETPSSSSETVPPGVRQGYNAFDEVYRPKIGRGTEKRVVEQLRDGVALTYQKTHSAWSAMSACNYINRQLQELSKDFGVDIACSATMHTGPILSGLLGSRAVRYDIYGPTVFQAEEMAALVRKPRLIALSDSAAQALLRSCTWFGFLFRERWPLTAPRNTASRDYTNRRAVSGSAAGISSQRSFVSVLHWDPEVDKSLDNCSAIAAETVKFKSVVLPDEVSSYFDSNHSAANNGAMSPGLTPLPECEKIPMDELQPLLHYLLPVVDDQEEVLTICLAQPDAGTAEEAHVFHPDIHRTRANYDDITFATVSSGSLGLYGIANSELVGKKLFDVIHPFDQDAFCQALDALVSANYAGRRKYLQQYKFAAAPTAAVVLVPEKINEEHVYRLYDADEDRYVEKWEVQSWTGPVAVCMQHRVVCAAGDRKADLKSAPSVVQWRWASTTIMEVDGVLVVLTRRLSPELAAELSSFVPADDPGALEEFSEKLYGEGTMTSQGYVIKENAEQAKGEDEELGKHHKKGKSNKKHKEASEHSRVSFGDFKLLQGLGAGQYATVYLALHKPSGNVFAIKRFNATQVRSKSLQAELKALSARQRHPNVVDFLCCLTGNDEIWLVMEHVRGIPLDILLRYEGKLNVETVKLLLAEVLLGVGFLHSLGILHRDVAEKNLMITREGHVKIIDFGLSVLVNPLETPSEVAASMNTPSAFIEGSSAPSGSVNDSVNDTSSVETNEASQGSVPDRKVSDKGRQKTVQSEDEKAVERSADSAPESKEDQPSRLRRSLDTNETSEQSNSAYKSNSDSYSYSNAFEQAANAISRDSPFSENLVALLQSLIPAPDNRVVKRLYNPQKYRLAAVSKNQQAEKQNEQSYALGSIPEQGTAEEQESRGNKNRRNFDKATTVLLLTLDDGGQFIQYLTSLYASQHASQAGLPQAAVADGAVPGSLKPSWLSPRAQRRDVAASLRSKSVHLVKVNTLEEAETTLRRDAPIFDAFLIHCLGHPEMALPALQMRYALSQEVSAASQLPAAVIFTAPAGEWQQLFAQKYAAEGAAMCIAMPFSRQSLRAVCLLARHTNEQREAALKRVRTLQHHAEDNAAFRSTKDSERSNFADNALLRMGQQSTASYADYSKSKGGGESAYQSHEFAGLMGDDFNRMKASLSRGPLSVQNADGSGNMLPRESSTTSSGVATKQMLDQLGGFASKGSSSAETTSVASSGSNRSTYFDYINTSAKRSSPFITSQAKTRPSRPSMKFGVANSLGPTVNTIAGTPHYMAPETLMRKTGLASDYFAVGVLAFRLLSGFYPFSGTTRRQVQENIMKNKINWSKLPPGLPQDVIQLLHALLHPDPAHRLGGRDGVRSIMAHSFFSDIDWANISYAVSPLADLASKLDPFADEFEDDDDNDVKKKQAVAASEASDFLLEKSEGGSSYNLPSIAGMAGGAIPEVPDSSSSESSATRRPRVKQTKEKELGSNNSEESLNAQVSVVGSGSTGLTKPNVTSMPWSTVGTHSTQGYSVNSAPTSGGNVASGNFQTGYEAGYRKALEDARAEMAARTSQGAATTSTSGMPRGAPPFGSSVITPRSAMGVNARSGGVDMFGEGGHYATAFSPQSVVQGDASLSESRDLNYEGTYSAQTTPQSGSMGNQLLSAAYSQYDSQSALSRPHIGGQSNAGGMWTAPNYSSLGSQSGTVPGAVGRTTNMAPMSQSVQFASAEQSLSGNWASPLQPGYEPSAGPSVQWPAGTGHASTRFAEPPAQRSGAAPFDRRSAFLSQHSTRGGVFASGDLPNLPQASRGPPPLRPQDSGSITSGQFASGQFPDLSSMDADAAHYPRMEEAQFGSYAEAKASGSIEVPMLPNNSSRRSWRPPVPATGQAGMVSGGRGISRLSSETSYMEEETG